MASEYGRYGYRKITALLLEAGWQIGKDRVPLFLWHFQPFASPESN